MVAAAGPLSVNIAAITGADPRVASRTPSRNASGAASASCGSTLASEFHKSPVVSALASRSSSRTTRAARCVPLAPWPVSITSP